VDGVAFYHLILGRKKAGDLFQISCSVCRYVGGGYLIVKVRGKLTRCEADKLELFYFFIFLISGYSPYPRKRIPIINAIPAAIAKKGPTHSRPAANKVAFHETTPLINIAAEIYRAEIKTADMKQKIAPTILFSI
jgi:hypothetical protein